MTLRKQMRINPEVFGDDYGNAVMYVPIDEVIHFLEEERSDIPAHGFEFANCFKALKDESWEHLSKGEN